VKLKKKLKPQFLIIISFLCVILVGTLILLLPISTKDRKGLPFIDALFLATSSTCVTGLSTVSVGEALSTFGHLTVLIMIEIGGLSFLTLVSFIYSLVGAKIGISSRLLMKETLNQDTSRGVVQLVKKVVPLAVIIQLIGIVLLFFIFKFRYDYSFVTSLKYGLFHAVSAFNNAGIDIFRNEMPSLIPYSSDVMLNIIIMVLITLGGLGFIVIIDVLSKRRWYKLQLHTKLVLIVTIIILVTGALGYKLFFYLSGDNITWLQAFFQSVTTRTAGFASIDQARVEACKPAYLLSVIQMFIGASPCSTGGGLKTTTFSVIIISILCFSKGQTPNVFKRKINQQTINKVFILFVVEISYLALAILLACAFEAKSPFSLESIAYEVISAFDTVGLSTGITSSLNVATKILIIITMFIGRLGPLTFISMWTSRTNLIMSRDVKFVEGKILIG
jgi:trk system potassium uptake protein trkG